jgi:hypothetical protein
MKKFLLAGIVLCILSFACKTTVDSSSPTASTWEKQSAVTTENQNNIVDGGIAIAAMVFVVVIATLLLTMRTNQPVPYDWKYQV